MEVKIKGVLAVLLLFAILGTGCGRELTEEPGIWESDNTEELQTENSEEVRSDDETEQETELEISEDLEGWENKGERHQYIWGTWVVKARWLGESWNEDGAWIGGIMELRPDYYTYEDQTHSYSVEIKGYYASSQPIRAADGGDWIGLTTNYCLAIEPSFDVYDEFGPFNHFYLMGKEEMFAYSPRCPLYRLEKIDNYETWVEDADYTLSLLGFERGEWEVTKVLKASQRDATHYIGERLETRRGWGEDEAEVFQSIYLLDVQEDSIRKLVEAMGLKEQPFVICFDFIEDFYWDKMIIKDEMTVVLVKDGNYFWARRVSEPMKEYLLGQL